MRQFSIQSRRSPDGHPTVNRQSTIASLSSHYSQYALILTTTLLLLFTLSIGNAWADNTKHPVYCAINPSSLGETGVLYLNVHKGTTSDGGDWYRVKMDKIATTIHKAATGETKDLYVASIEYAEVGLQQLEFQIYDTPPPADPRETHVAFNSWTTSSDTWTKQVFDYENGNFTTYPAGLAQKKSYIYFNAADWNDDVKQLVISHGTYRGFNDLNHLSNTTLYYANPDLNWDDAVCISFIGNSTSWSETGKWLNDIPLWSTHYTGYLHYSLSENSFNYFARRSGDEKGAALSYNYWGTESTAYQNLNKTQTVQARVKATGSSYSDASFASWPGTVSVERTYMSSATATSSPSAANMTSAITDAVLTSSITLTASANSGYYFEGWGDASDSNPTDGTAAKTYTITDTKTSYAFFSQAYTLTYARKGDYSTSTVSVYSVDNYSGATNTGSSIPTGHMITLVATPATGYEVEGWYSDASCENAYTNGTAGVTIEGGNNTFKLASLNANSGVYCKFRPKSYTITLVNMEATEAGTESVDVTYNASTNMTSAISKPSKTNYTFDGYWISNDAGTTLTNIQLIDADGNWIADVEGYTGNDGADHPTWAHDYAISLYAKWNETPRTITLQVSLTGAGSVSPSGSTTAYFVTPSGEITATANPGWVFKEWQFTKVGEDYTVWADDAYNSTSNPIQVKATANATLTAVFEPRYCLVGSLQDNSGNGGLPGWSDYTADFTVNSSLPVDLTRTCTLLADKTYKVQVHDKTTNTNLGRSGCNPVCVLAENASLVMENANNDVYLYTTGAGEYIFKITAIDGSGHPTLTVLRPHQVNFGQKYQDIDGTLHTGNTGGTIFVTAGGALSSGDWVTYNTSVTHTATAASPGYTFAGWWDSDAFTGNPFSKNTPMTYAVTATDNAFAKFTETPTTVTLANDGHGHVEIGSGNTVTQTTVGVTTTRELTAVPNDGYMFSSWTETAKTDYSTTSTSTNPTTLRGGGTGAASQTLTANFTYRWALKAESGNWGNSEFTIANIPTDGSGDVIGYVDISLAANTNYQFKMVDKLTSTDYYNGSDKVYFMTYGNSSEWPFATDKTHNCGITTAGKGTYRFSWNVTDKTMTVTYQPSYQVNYGASVGGSVTSVVDDDGNSIPNGGYVRSGGSVEYTAAAANAYYTFAGWCTDDTYAMQFTDKNQNPWTNSDITANSNAYAKFISSNFVIYRTGDKAEDSRAAVDDVESYAGGTISEAIEYRMKVHTLNQWTTLCLPFEVNAVQVWDPADGPDYYDIVPYYRTGGKFYNGHYIIRTPKTATDLAIAEFDQWNDPTSATGYVPDANTPYIIQWHDEYFLNKYISFFGDAEQTIPSSMSVGAAPSSDNVVNVYGNDAMVSGTVSDAYLLVPDYGSSGAWLRENIGTNRTINPFECYIRANSATTTRYRILRRGAIPDDTPTGWDDVINAEPRTDIMVYTITGFPVARYYDCSFTEAAQRLHREQGEGIYILRSANESVKLMVGGK